MAFVIKKASEAVEENGVKLVVYGSSGVGKTTLAKTAPKPLILSAEKGLLSLKDTDLPVAEVRTPQDLIEAYNYLAGEGAGTFETVIIDSLSEVLEILLADLKPRFKDPRQAYGELIEQTNKLVRRFRDLPMNVVFLCKEVRREDSFGVVTYAPSLPGSKCGEALPYLIDNVCRMYVGKGQDAAGKDITYRALLAQPDGISEVKDRSGTLPNIVKPDLAEMFQLIKKS